MIFQSGLNALINSYVFSREKIFYAQQKRGFMGPLSLLAITLYMENRLYELFSRALTAVMVGTGVTLSLSLEVVVAVVVGVVLEVVVFFSIIIFYYYCRFHYPRYLLLFC